MTRGCVLRRNLCGVEQKGIEPSTSALRTLRSPTIPSENEGVCQRSRPINGPFVYKSVYSATIRVMSLREDEESPDAGEAAHDLGAVREALGQELPGEVVLRQLPPARRAADEGGVLAGGQRVVGGQAGRAGGNLPPARASPRRPRLPPAEGRGGRGAAGSGGEGAGGGGSGHVPGGPGGGAARRAVEDPRRRPEQ